MDPKTKKIIIKILKIFVKAVFTGLAYSLVARVWRL